MNFKDNVWKTRKARINLAERLKKYDFYSQVLIIYYSLLLIIFTILDIQNKKNDFSVIELIFSIAILVISIFIYAMNFKERSLKTQSTYIKMNKIYRKLGTSENTSSLEDEYHQLLEDSENHTECDYLKVLHAVHNDDNYKNKKFTCSNHISFFFCAIKNNILIFLLFITPLIFILYKFFYVC